jgi:hypothetical protein
MYITIDFSAAHDVICDLCGWLDSRGGVELEDDRGTRKVFCHDCVTTLVRECLPDGQFGSFDPRTATLPEAVLV